MIRIQDTELQIVKDILTTFFPYAEIRVFGSRITDKFKEYSDLDLAVITPQKIDIKLFLHAKEAFQESVLSFRVDLIDWHRIDENFRKIIDKNYEKLQ